MASVDVLDSTMTYLDTGTGTPFVFLHGNPTSSYLWRKVLPRIGPPARLLAPDLIGMGGSGKPAVEYRFGDHARYLDAWFDALDLTGAVLVGHDWGGALAFDWARRHPHRVRGVAFLETIVKPMSWAEFPDGARELFRRMRTPGEGEAMVLEQNLFLRDLLPRTVASGLDEHDRAAYLQPYPTPESRRPLLAWPRSMPLDGEPADVVERIDAYDAWLGSTPEVPKLLLTFDSHPTLLVGPALVDWCRAHVAGLEVEYCGPAAHHAPEDRPEAIAAALSAWADRHGFRG